jgi:uncharacterized protein with von Willebrand factor type A (vWA) domain
VAQGLLDRTVGLSGSLRRAGIPVSLAESLDAVRAMGAVGLADREGLRAGLAAAMVKRAAHRPAYDALFDLWFPALVGEPAGPGADDPDSRGGPYGRDDAAADPQSSPTDARISAQQRDQLRERLAELVLDGDDAALRRFAQQMVGRLGRAESQPGRQSYFAYRVFRALAPDTLVAGLIAAVLDRGGTERTAFTEEVARRTVTARLEALRQYVDADVRRRLAEERGVEQVAETAVAPLVEQVDFLRASRDDLVQLRRQVHPLARRLATRLSARRRLGRSGRLDMRRTVRASLGTGGVPVVTHHRPRAAHKPELVILCDVSGSVASFAHFTLMLTWALHEQFTKVRVFAFIDGCDEVTRFLEGTDDVAQALALMSRQAQLVWFDGHSDYGHAFETFDEKYASAITPRTSLLVLGDGRTNFRNPALPVLRRMAASARHAYWLNPEPAAQWGSGDSAAPRYAEVIEMVECRTVAQLEQFVSRLLPV